MENKANKEKVITFEILNTLQKKRAGNLSGGELRFLEIVLILNLNRPFVFLDEPFTGLSPLYQEHIHHFLSEARKDKGIIVTDQDYRNIIDISDRIIVIKNGKSIHIKRKEELIDLNYLTEIREN